MFRKLLMVAITLVLVSCRSEIDMSEVNDQGANDIDWTEKEAKYLNRISELNDEIDMMNESSHEVLLTMEKVINDYQNMVTNLEKRLEMKENELDEVQEDLDSLSSWHTYFTSSVQGYFEDTTSTHFVGEWVKVGDEFAGVKIASISTYKKNFQAIKFEGEMTVTGVLSFLDINSTTYGKLELDDASKEILPRFFNLSVSQIQLRNALDFMNDIESYEGAEITIVIDRYEIGNFPPGWVTSADIIKVVD